MLWLALGLTLANVTRSNVRAGVGAEVPCVAAVLGGILGQELIRAAAADDTPIQGVLVYDAFACTAIQIARN